MLAPRDGADVAHRRFDVADAVAREHGPQLVEQFVFSHRGVGKEARIDRGDRLDEPSSGYSISLRLHGESMPRCETDHACERAECLAVRLCGAGSFVGRCKLQQVSKRQANGMR